MLSVYRRELKSYFSNLTGYIPVVLITLMSGIFVKLVCFDAGQPNMEIALPVTSLILIVAIPILAMRSFAEEKRSKTDLLLYSLPLSTTDIVLGKFFAMLTVLAIPCGLMMIVPFIASMYGTVNILLSLASILAFFLLAAAMAAICMFMSTVTESQAIAAVLGVGSLILLYCISLVSEVIPTTAVASLVSLSIIVIIVAIVVYLFTKDYWISFTIGVLLEAVLLIFYTRAKESFTGLIQTVLDKADIFGMLSDFVNGELFDMTVIIYYISVAVLFCFFTAQNVEKRRWN